MGSALHAGLGATGIVALLALFILIGWVRNACCNARVGVVFSQRYAFNWTNGAKSSNSPFAYILGVVTNLPDTLRHSLRTI